MTPTPNQVQKSTQQAAPQGQAQAQQGQAKAPSRTGQGSEGDGPRFTDWASI